MNVQLSSSMMLLGGFEDILDLMGGIILDLSNPLCPEIDLDEKGEERIIKLFCKRLWQILAKNGDIKVSDSLFFSP